MTPHPFFFSKSEPTPHLLSIYTTDGSTIHGNSIGFISTSNLLISWVFQVPGLSYNLFYVGQLAELVYCLIFYYSRGTVQDRRTGQEIGTSPRDGHMFPVDNLRL